MKDPISDFMFSVIGKQFGPSFPIGAIPKGVCWDFCKEVHKLNGKSLPNIVAIRDVLGKVKNPEVLDLVIFQFGELFHGGVVWPDGLHFVHAVPCQGVKEIKFIIEQGRVTAFPWNTSLEGFYHVI
jgi:hypothetical protein